ncbi:MAG: Hsp70 family protein, partial [Rhodospirillales bacterium]|nr:Hsp70 family protein [Rhodospirillales bacterium]
ETTTGVAQHVEVKPSYGLSEDEMADMLRDSMVHAKDDMAARLLSEARVEGSRVLNAVISALRADGDLLDDQERGKVEGFAKALAEAIDGTDREVIDERVGELDRATQEFASRRMDRGINAALSGVAVDNLENKVS